MKNSLKLLWVALFALGIIFIVIGQVRGPELFPLSSPDSLEDGATPDPRGPQPESSGSFIGSLPPATCALSGSIIYLNPTLYETRGAKISYMNVDHPARLINWRVVPEDDLSIGPNIFSQLQLPNGEQSISVNIPENPLHRNYKLTAAITYGQTDENGAVILREAQCIGSVDVLLTF